MSPNYWATYNWTGNYYFRRSRYADAEVMFRKAVELNQGNQRALYNLGAMYLVEGRYQDAIDALQRSLGSRPTMSAYSNLGAAYFYLRRYREATSAFEKARALDDRDYLNWGNLGDALYWSPARRPEATGTYRRAIELAQVRLQVDPKDATAHAYVAEYSAMVNDKTLALEQIQKALELAPKDSDVMFRAGLVYNQLSDRRKTLDWLKKAVDANYSITVIRDTPDFAHLQTDPEFRAIISAK
jgi:tetratricopeptide (TPR) repeat protein